MPRPTPRHLAGAVLACLLAGTVVVSSLLTFWSVAGSAAGLLLAGALLLLLGMRRRQQVAAQQLRMIAGRLSSTSDETRQGLDALRAEVRQGALDATSVRGELSALQDSLRHSRQIQVEAAEASAAEAKMARAHAQTMRKTLERLPGHLLTEVQALDQLLSRYSPRSPLPVVGGWAVSPTGLLWLVDFVDRVRPDLVVECGSGTSTLWLAQSMREHGRGRVVAIEHQSVFAEKTRAMLRDHGLADWAEVRFAPLTEVATPRGTFPWYDVDPDTLGEIDLLLVDGPPAATGPEARYPALPILSGRLSAGAHILVDDARREGEKTAIARWLEEDHRLADLGAPTLEARLLRRD